MICSNMRDGHLLLQTLEKHHKAQHFSLLVSPKTQVTHKELQIPQKSIRNCNQHTRCLNQRWKKTENQNNKQINGRSTKETKGQGLVGRIRLVRLRSLRRNRNRNHIRPYKIITGTETTKAKATATARATATTASAATATATAAAAAAASAAAPLKQLRNTSTAEAMHLGDRMRKLVHSDKWKVFV